MEFLFGALGALAVLGLMALGGCLGWHLKELQVRHQKTPLEQISEEQKKEFLAQQAAFNDMMNYNPETAYGLNREPLGKEG